MEHKTIYIVNPYSIADFCNKLERLDIPFSNGPCGTIGRDYLLEVTFKNEEDKTLAKLTMSDFKEYNEDDDAAI